MAKFEFELPKELMDDFKMLNENADDIFGQMTKAGAEVVYNNIKRNVPDSIRNSEMMNCLRVTKQYKTPSDDGINTKVAFYGYFTSEKGEKTPAPLIANMFEYGRSNLPFPKKPFLRKSFNKKDIEKAMLEAQKKASGGLLDE